MTSRLSSALVVLALLAALLASGTARAQNSIWMDPVPGGWPCEIRPYVFDSMLRPPSIAPMLHCETVRVEVDSAPGFSSTLTFDLADPCILDLSSEEYTRWICP